MKIVGQYCQRQRSKHVELEQFWHALASRGFVSDSWAFLFKPIFTITLEAMGLASKKNLIGFRQNLEHGIGKKIKLVCLGHAVLG